MIHWRKEWQPTPGFLPREPHGQYEKAERYDTEDEPPQVRKCPVCYWRRAVQLLIAPVRMMHLGQTKNDAQLCICLLVKVEPNATKNNIA